MWNRLAKAAVPPLAEGAHKGQAGRIAVVGGSLEYTGAPYFAAISALKVGADLAHVFCSEGAAPVIKSYSPELIVHPLLDNEGAVDEIDRWLERMHAVVVGPGLGRDPVTLRTAAAVVERCRRRAKPLVVDADGLALFSEDLRLVEGYPAPGAVLTPNAAEYQRLRAKIDLDRLGANVLILKKGRADETLSADENARWSEGAGGSPRRCGGQGDLLSGATATFLHWSSTGGEGGTVAVRLATACYAACRLTRRCNEKAYASKGRSALCSDMIDAIHDSFVELFENK